MQLGVLRVPELCLTMSAIIAASLGSSCTTFSLGGT